MIDSLLTLNEHLEIIVTKEDTDRYKATTPTFPKCKGFGANKDEAISKLSRSIGSHLARKTTKNIEKLLKSRAYTEVITNPSSKSSDQHLVFSLYDSPPVAKHDVFVKLDELQEFFTSDAPESSVVTPNFPIQETINTGSTLSIDAPPMEIDPTAGPSQLDSGRHLLCGIQFSLN
jgi:hypothetical protein